MRIKVSLHEPGLADGVYEVKEKGCILARLSWANEGGNLEEYAPFAYLPLDTDGSGRFVFIGGRSVPEEADRVCVKAVTTDLSEIREAYYRIPEVHRTHSYYGGSAVMMRIGLISDLHMTNKSGRINGALERVNDMDVVLMAGDLVNNCDPAQYERLAGSIEEVMPDTPMFAVAGNHDIPKGDALNYQRFEQWLRRRIQGRYSITDSGLGAFAVILDSKVDLIGLNPMYTQKIFHFPGKGAQLKWLEQYLAGSPVKQHIIMCHAPLLAHNPQRDPGKKAPYLAQDVLLQDIVNQTGHVIFLSGHTHLSPNIPGGCVEYDDTRSNLYINDGSVCPVDIKSHETILPPEWADGCYTELVLYEDCVEIIMRFQRSGRRISRGYYKIPIR